MLLHLFPATFVRIAIFAALLVGFACGTARAGSEKVILGDKHRFTSSVLGEDRVVLVRLPKGYQASAQRYPVLYVLDGEFFFYQAVSAVQFLSERQYGYGRVHPVPELIIVGIVNVDRNRDFTPSHAPEQGPNGLYPTSGQAGKFLEFLQKELIPFIDREYRTQPYRILAGWSLGGLFTVHTLMERTNLFSAYLAISPSLWWNEMEPVKRAEVLLQQGKFPDAKLVVTLGSLEGGAIGGSVRDRFLRLFNGGAKGGPSPITVEIPAEGHSDVPIKALYEGLKSLYADSIMPNDVLPGGWPAVEAFYRDLSKRYGYPVEIPESAYGRMVIQLARADRQQDALELAKLWVKKFPRSSWPIFQLGARHLRLGDPAQARTCYERALQIEQAGAEPDSERIVAYQINLRELAAAEQKKNK